MVVYRTGEALEESLRLRVADPLVDELIVVDNGSTGAGARAWRALAERRHAGGAAGRPRQHRLRPGRQPGRARRPRATSWCSSIPTPSCRPGCIAELAREIAGRPVPCIVGGRVLNADGTEQRGARRGDITPVNAFLSLSRLARARPPGAVRGPPRGRGHAGAMPRGADHLRRLLRHAPRRLRRLRRLRRGILPARGGRGPVLAGARLGRRGAVPAPRPRWSTWAPPA